MQNEEIRSSYSKCLLTLRWQERVLFSVQKETQDLLRTPREKRERSERTLKIGGEIPRKEQEKILRSGGWRH